MLSWAILWPFPISIEAAEVLTIKWGIISVLEACLLSFSVACDHFNTMNALNIKDRNLCQFGVILNEILDLAKHS